MGILLSIVMVIETSYQAASLVLYQCSILYLNFVKSENSRTITFLGSGDKCIPTGPLERITQQSLLEDEVDAVVKAGFFVPNINNVITCVSFTFNATSYQARKGGIRRLRDSSV